VDAVNDKEWYKETVDGTARVDALCLPIIDCTAVCVHADWRIFRCAGMAAMGMTPEEISQVFRIVSAVLWLGQVELHADQEKYALSAMPGSDCRRALLTTRL